MSNEMVTLNVTPEQHRLIMNAIANEIAKLNEMECGTLECEIEALEELEMALDSQDPSEITPEFNEWMVEVNRILIAHCGCGIEDIADQSYWDTWNAGATPKEMLAKIIRNDYGF